MDYIYLNENFHGPSKYYANDIAVIVLSNDVKISDDVLPVCVDWDKQQTNPRGTGKVNRWETKYFFVDTDILHV